MTAYSLALQKDISLWDRGVSRDAHALKTQFEEVIDGLSKSMVLSEPSQKALKALENVFEECSNKDWDGYGAQAVNRSTFFQAEKFLANLPTTFPLPDINAEPDGEIAFEWYTDPRRVLSVSVGSGNRISYAGIFGKSSAHGTEYFEDEIPKTIIQQLGRLFSQET